MTQPQLYLWFEKTVLREKEEKIAEEKAEWNRTANLLAMIWNTQWGIKKKDQKEAKDFMPDFDDIESNNEELVKRAKDKGITPPNKY